MRFTDRRLVVFACVLAAVSVASCVVTVPLQGWLTARDAPVADLYAADLLLGGIWPLTGALVAVRQPRNRAAWVLLGTSLLGPYELLSHYAVADAVAGPLPLAPFAAWLACWGYAPYFLCIPLLPILFPDGHAPSPGWRLFARILLGGGILATLFSMIRPGSADVSPIVENPLGLPESASSVVMVFTMGGAYLILFTGTVAGVICLVLRARRSEGADRARMQWLMLGGVVLAVTMTLSALPMGAAAQEALMSVGIVALPASVAVAVFRHQLFDVEAVLGRTVAYTLLICGVLGVYALGIAWVGRLTSGSGLGYALVGSAAVAITSAHGRVRQAVERMLFGHRRDPYAVLSRVGRQVEPASEPVDALQRLVDALRTTLDVPYAAFAGPVAELSSGAPVAGWHHVPCLALGREVGALHVGLRHPEERLLPQELEAITELAARAATLAYAAALVEDVAASRARIVTAREEERRRLRADLHDGLGPVLAGTAHQLDALSRRITRATALVPASSAGVAASQAVVAVADLEVWAESAKGLRARLKTAVGDLRTVVHGLRPPVLDQLGLPGALRELVSGYETPVCSHRVTGECAELPAAVEVAAYRIAAEAVNNGLRHSAAGALRLDAEVVRDALVVTVEDNGRGMPVRPRMGVGLRSMRERAEEVGGRLELSNVAGGGTRVRAVLPLERVVR